MATRYLGAEFDIHGGGLDLRFPHHENELAQSHAAGDPFARYWLHNAWVVQGGEKMSKSLGNTMAVATLVQRIPAVVVRYLLVAPHYRSNIEIVDGSMEEARTAYERIEGFVARAVELAGDVVSAADPASVPLPAAFTAALDDDLSTPAAVAVVHEVVTRGNTALAASDTEGLAAALGSVRAMLGVLGLDPLHPQWADAGGDRRLAQATDGLVQLALDQRAAARARKDYAAADAIRDQLGALGVQVEDTPQGTRWELT
jgi:cysteinyl-tRNA synthetase